MNGIELIRQINEKYPHMNVLFVSGYAESSRADINPVVSGSRSLSIRTNSLRRSPKPLR